MRKLSIILAALAFELVPLFALAQPVSGTYTSPNRGGFVLVGRSSVARQFVNSGNTKIFHGQSWNGATLGTQWEIACGIQTTDTPPDYTNYNGTTGSGFIVYTQTFNGGTLTLYTDASVGWGSGVANLGVTQVTSQVFMQNFAPVSSSFTAYTSGTFQAPYDNCELTFALGNGFGVGETPYLSKPADYPAFLAATCGPADAAHQFGVWGDTNDLILTIDCGPVSTEQSTWGHVKALYR